MKKIFLMSGYAESGKDTVADIIAEKLNGSSMKVAMADYLKHMATKYYNWDGKKDIKGREILQKLGTETIRDGLNWQTFHAERVCQDIEIIKDDYDYIFIPDVRFKNEMYYTMAKFPEDTISIRVTRPYHDNKLTDEQRKHRSEVDILGVKHDYEIYTGEGLEAVERTVDKVLGELIKRFNE